MSNHHLRDKNLSLKAKGLLSQMLSLPEDWDYTPGGSFSYQPGEQGCHPLRCQRAEKAGYVQRRQTTDASGKFSANEYVIHECPVLPESPSGGPSLKNRRRKTRQRIIRQRETVIGKSNAIKY